MIMKRVALFSQNEQTAHDVEKTLVGYEVFISAKIKQTLNFLRQGETLPVLFLDLDTPNMLGFELLANIKFDKKLNSIRIILIGSEETIEANLHSEEFQMIEYLKTPINIEVLEMAVKAIHKDEEQLLVTKRIRNMQAIFAALFKSAPFGISINRYFVKEGMRLQSFRANKAFQEILGVKTKATTDEIDWRKATHPDDLEKDNELFNKFISGEIESYEIEKRFIQPSGKVVWTHLIVTKIDLQDENIFTYFAIIRDISMRKGFESSLIESERSKSVLLSNLPGLAFRSKVDDHFTKEFVSKGSLELTGYDPDAFINGRDLHFIDLLDPSYVKEICQLQLNAIKKKESYRFQYPIITKDQRRKWVLEVGEPIINLEGEVEALEGIIIDINEMKKYEAEIKRISEYDDWTTLHNRRYLETLIAYDLTYDKKSTKVLILFNLNSIQGLTGIHGYHYTKDLMKRISHKLKTLENENFQLYITHETRLTFYIKNSTEEEIRKFYRRAVELLEPLLWSERITCRVGALEIPWRSRANQVDTILKNLLSTTEKDVITDDKLIEIYFFDDDLVLKLERKRKIIKELTDAAIKKDDRLFLQYQPIYNVKTNRIIGFEALARFRSHELGIVPPLEFIPLLETNKLMIVYGEKINSLALEFLKKLHDQGYDDLYISINVSFQQLLDRQFVKKFLKLVDDIGVNPKYIWLELTETSFTTSYFNINGLLKKLTSQGIRVAIDDFGTGFSSLYRLISLEINAIKIDRAFLLGIELIEINKAIYEDIISLGHKLGFFVVGEGVENDTHLDYLKTYGCDYAQGYFLARPQNEEDALKLLKKKK